MKDSMQKQYTAIAAHNGLTAKITSGLGFDFLWASSLEVSASFGYPDASIVGFETIKQTVENMVEMSSVPVIVDCDTGYGNIVNVYYYFQKLKKVGAKGVCIEDNIFPKQNSFYKGSRKLEDAHVFASKIKVAKSIFNGPGEFVIARTESLIQGLGVKEALDRSNLYMESGADYIMPHSKKSDTQELFEFAELWQKKLPLVAVPSTYYTVQRDELQKQGFSIIIYANHTTRTIKKALEETLPEILKNGSSESIESKISPLKELLELTGESKVKELEATFN